MAGAPFLSPFPLIRCSFQIIRDPEGKKEGRELKKPIEASVTRLSLEKLDQIGTLVTSHK